MDYYDLLGIKRTATQEEVRSAYRKLAFKLHPDRTSDEESAKKFKEISEAYDILSDPDRRKAYDLYGKGAPASANRGDYAGGDEFERMFDMMGKVFSGSPFKDIFTATSEKKPASKKKGAKGAKGAKSDKCANCNGDGKVGGNFGFFAFQIACPICLGSGRAKK